MTIETSPKGEWEEEEELDDNAFKDVELPVFDDDRLQRIQSLQDDETLRECQDLLKEDAQLPTKLGALAKSINIRSFLRHRSLFHNSPQGVLMRLWTTPKEEVIKLIVVGDEGFERLLIHKFDPSRPSLIAHLGMRKTMTSLSSRFYAFGMKRVNAFVNKCSDCKLNNPPNVRREKDGNQLRTEENAMLVMDLLGPINSLNSPITPQYVCLMIDAVSL